MASRRRRVRWWLKWAGLILCIMMAVTWGLSAWATTEVFWGHWSFGSSAGCVICRYGPPIDMPQGFSTRSHKAPPLLLWWNFFGEWHFGGYTEILVRVNHWAVLLAVGMLTACLWYDDRRQPKGFCHECGYDLTGNVSGVCPECGRVI